MYKKILKYLIITVLIISCDKVNKHSNNIINKSSKIIPANYEGNDFNISETIIKMLVDDNKIYVGTYKDLQVFDKNTKEKLYVLEDKQYKPWDNIYSDDKYIYKMYSKIVKVFSKINGNLDKTFSLETKKDAVFDIKIDDKYLYAQSYDYGKSGYSSFINFDFSIFNKNNGDFVKNIDIHKGHFTKSTIGDKFIYISNNYQDDIHVYNKDTLSYDSNISINKVSELTTHNDNIYAVNDSGVVVVDRFNKQIVDTFHTFKEEAYKNNISKLHVNNNHIFLLHDKNKMTIFSIEKRKIIKVLSYDSYRQSISINNNHLYIIDTNNKISIVDISDDAIIIKNNTSKYFIEMIKFKNDFSYMTLSPNSNYVAYRSYKNIGDTTFKEYVSLLNLNTKKIILESFGIKHKNLLTFSPDEKYFIYATNDYTMVLNIDTNISKNIVTRKELENTQSAPPPFTREVSNTFYINNIIRDSYISSSNQDITYFVSSKEREMIMIKNIHTNEESKIIYMHTELPSPLSNFKFSPNKQYIAYIGYESGYGKDKSINILNIKTKVKISKIAKEALLFSFNPNSKHIALYIDSSYENKANISIYTISGELVKKIITNQTYTNTIKYSPDGKYIITGHNDSTIKVWDTKKAKLVEILREHTNEVTFLSFTKDGSKLISGSGRDRTVRIWDFDSIVSDYMNL